MSSSICLLYRNSDKRILYTEAGKEFVDLLLSLLGLPLGYVMKLLSKHSSSAGMGSIAKLYESACNLDEPLLYVRKEEFINQKPSKPLPFLLAANLETTADAQFFYYKCNYCNKFTKAHSRKSSYDYDFCYCCNDSYDYYSSDDSYDYARSKGTFCEELTLVEGTPDSPPAGKPGFVKKSSRFIISDDLTITHFSTIKSIDLLRSLNVHNISDLMSMELTVGENEVVAIVKASLTSKTVLNDVFKTQVQNQAPKDVNELKIKLTEVRKQLTTLTEERNNALQLTQQLQQELAKLGSATDSKGYAEKGPVQRDAGFSFLFVFLVGLLGILVGFLIGS